MFQKQQMPIGLSIFVLVLASIVGCQWPDGEHRMPTAPGTSSALTNYAQMDEGSTIVGGQQINWVVSAWGAFPYGQWMYIEVNQQDGIGKLPGNGQIPVTLQNVVLSFDELPTAVTDILIGVKALHDEQDQTFTERGRFAVVNGSVKIPIAHADLIAYFGVTHYSLWFQALGGENGAGEVSGQIALSGVMPNGEGVTFRKLVKFGTNPAPAPNPMPASSSTPVPTSTCPTVPAQCVVQNINDSGAGSLRQALADLATSGCATLTFADAIAGQTITLKTGELYVPHNVTIHGCSGMTISGNNASRVMTIDANVNVTLDALTITRGKDIEGVGGGGIANLGTLTLSASTTVSNSTTNAEEGGGGILNGGTLTIYGTVSHNTATGGNGGGIANFGALLTMYGTVSNNTAQNGGGIASMLGTLIISGMVNGNTANEGGGIHNEGGKLTLSGTVSNNTAKNGGGIFNLTEGNLTITPGGVVSNNIAQSGGGGIWNEIASVTVNGTVSGNTAEYGGGMCNMMSGGEITVNGDVSKNTAKTAGGGIYNDAILTLNGTVSNNMAATHGGGIYNISKLTLNGTVSNNTANADGGGILSMETEPSILNSGNLIQGNHCDNDNSGTGNGGGMWIGESAPPAGANYGMHNYRGSGTGVIEDYYIFTP